MGDWTHLLTTDPFSSLSSWQLWAFYKKRVQGRRDGRREIIIKLQNVEDKRAAFYLTSLRKWVPKATPSLKSSGTGSPRSIYFFFLSFLNVYLFLREREQSVSGGGAERRGNRIWGRLQAPSHQHRCLTRGSNSQAVRSWPEPKSDAQPAEPARCPIQEHLKAR